MKKISQRVIYEFVLVAVALCGIGYLIFSSITNQLNTALKENILRHIGTVSYSIENTLNREISGMQSGAAWLESSGADIQNFNAIANALGKTTHISGILRMDGSSIISTGQPLPPDKVNLVSAAFYGQNVIVYKEGLGMILATPMNINGEPCACYQIYSKESMPELFGIISYDGLGRITFVNAQGEWVKITNSTNDEVYSKLFADPEFVKEVHEKIGQQLSTSNRVVEKLSYNGEDFLGFGAKVKNENYLYGVVTLNAVSAGSEYTHMAMAGGMVAMLIILVMYARASLKSEENKELKIETETAIQASKTKSEFLSNMSHEIRTPINAILGMNEMILREAKSETILEYAENVRTAGNNLLGLVNDILDFSKIEAGKMEIIPVEYELSSMINDLVNMIQKRAEKKNLKLVVNVDKTLPTMLFGDEVRIRQVVTNILTNAVKYTEKGSITLSVGFTERKTENIKMKFSVKDTGIGIKPEDIKKLFSAFERIEEKRNRTIEGTGLGMNITKKLLNMMGTNLQVESIYGEGSNFSFEIEQKIINAEPIGDFAEAFRRSIKQHQTYHEKFTAPNAKILIVDDTVMNLTVVKGLLKQTRMKIDTAVSGFECLDLVQKNKYDIIFLDHRMPKMDGIETLQEMKKLSNNPNANTPVISLTANAISGAREEYMKAGFQDYLTKPINSAQLEELIMKYLPADKISSADSKQAEEEKPIEKLPDWVNKVIGLNVKEGIEHCGDVDSYMNALKVFAHSIPSAADDIGYYCATGDWKNYTTKVHALKSSARIIGANELSERAKRLEDAGNSGYFNEILNDTETLLKLYIGYIEKLSPLFEHEEDNSNKPPIDDDALSEAMEAMRDAAANFDDDSMEFVLKELKEYKLPPNEAERYEKIQAAFEKLDWEKINALLK